MLIISSLFTNALALSGPALRPALQPRCPAPVAALFGGSALRAARPRMVAFPSFGGKAEEDTGPPDAVLESFRLLGLDVDASYDDVEKKYDELAVTYAKDVKLKIKLGVAKDKIIDYRLSQRMSATKRGMGQARFGEDFKQAPKKPLITLPPFLDRIMELPDRALLTTNAVIFGIIGLLPALSRSWASTSISLGFGLGMWRLYNRGMAASTGDMEMEMRPPKVRPLLLTAGITILGGMIGSTLSLALYGSIFAFLPQEVRACARA